MKRTRRFSASETNRLSNDLGDRVCTTNRYSPLGNRFEHTNHIHYLVRLFMQTVSRALPCQYQHGCVVHVTVCHTRDQVRCTRTQSSKTTCRISSQPTIDLRHERGTLFMPGQDEPTPGTLLQRHDEISVLFTGYAEDVLDPLLFEAFDEQVRCFH